MTNVFQKNMLYIQKYAVDIDIYHRHKYDYNYYYYYHWRIKTTFPFEFIEMMRKSHHFYHRRGMSLKFEFNE